MTDPKRKKAHRAHGTGSILELGTNHYRLGYDCAGPGQKRKQRFETFRGTKSAAKTHLASLIDAARRGGTAHDDTLTFAQLAERFIAAKTIWREPTTVHLYPRTLRCHVLPVIGAIKVRKLTANHVTKMMGGAIDTSPRKKTRGQKLGPASQRSLRTLVSSILEFGIKTDVVVRNVAKMTEVPASAHKENVNFSLADVEAFIGASARTPLGPIVAFAIGTGMRRGEICGLRWTDLNLETAEYTLQRSAKNLNGKAFVGKLKTAKSRRTDHLRPFVLKTLKQHRIEQMEGHMALGIRPLDGGFVFTDPMGEMIDPNELSGTFGAFVRAKGLRRIRFHDLRHGFATLAYAADVPLKTISESLGHSSIGITSSIYVDVLDPAKVEKSNALDSYLGSAVARGLRNGATDTTASES